MLVAVELLTLALAHEQHLAYQVIDAILDGDPVFHEAVGRICNRPGVCAALRFMDGYPYRRGAGCQPIAGNVAAADASAGEKCDT